MHALLEKCNFMIFLFAYSATDVDFQRANQLIRSYDPVRAR